MHQSDSTMDVFWDNLLRIKGLGCGSGNGNNDQSGDIDESAGESNGGDTGSNESVEQELDKMLQQINDLWDPVYVELVGNTEAAELAFLIFLTNPEIFAALYADSEAWISSQLVADLEVFLNYSELHTTAENAVLGSFEDPDEATAMWSAHFYAGIGDIELAEETL